MALVSGFGSIARCIAGHVTDAARTPAKRPSVLKQPARCRPRGFADTQREGSIIATRKGAVGSVAVAPPAPLAHTGVTRTKLPFGRMVDAWRQPRPRREHPGGGELEIEHGERDRGAVESDHRGITEARERLVNVGLRATFCAVELLLAKSFAVDRATAFEARPAEVDRTMHRIRELDVAGTVADHLGADLRTGDEVLMAESIDGEAGKLRVGRREDEVAGKQLASVLGVADVARRGDDFDVGIDLRNHSTEDVDLQVSAPRVARCRADDARKVAHAHAVEIDDDDSTNTEMGEALDE